MLTNNSIITNKNRNNNAHSDADDINDTNYASINDISDDSMEKMSFANMLPLQETKYHTTITNISSLGHNLNITQS